MQLTEYDTHSMSQQPPTDRRLNKENLYLFVSFSPIYACAISPLSFIFCTSSKRIVESVMVFWKKNDDFPGKFNNVIVFWIYVFVTSPTWNTNPWVATLQLVWIPEQEVGP